LSTVRALLRVRWRSFISRCPLKQVARTPLTRRGPDNIQQYAKFLDSRSESVCTLICSCGCCLWHLESGHRYLWLGHVQTRVNHEGACARRLGASSSNPALRPTQGPDPGGHVRHHSCVRTRRLGPHRIISCVPISSLPFRQMTCHANECAVSPDKPYPLFAGFVHLGAGLACGFTGLSAGYAIGFIGDSVSRSTSALHPGSFLYAVIVCPGVRLRVKSVRVHGVNTHLCRGAGALWVSRCALPDIFLQTP
jgi:hypothetical protein